jgi:cyclase
MEGLRVVGNPGELAKNYASDGADELMFVDTVASLYNRNHLDTLLTETSQRIHIPLSAGGGVRSLDDIYRLLRNGADKVSFNTQALATPEIVLMAAKKFGSQCIVVSIQAKRAGASWEAYCRNGRERSGVDAVEWAHRVADLGAGEIFLTSVDMDGTCKGPDLSLIQAVTEAVHIPVVACGGTGTLDDAVAVAAAGASGLGVGHLLHFNKTTVADLKTKLASAGINVRQSQGAKAQP